MGAALFQYQASFWLDSCCGGIKSIKMLQYVIVSIVVGLSVGYLCFRAWRAWKSAADPCSGRDGCALKDMRRGGRALKKAKRECIDKKREKKFG